MRTRATLLAALLAGAPALAAAQDETDAFEAARAEAVELLIDEVEAFTGWCTAVKLYARRDRAWEALLAVAPDHEEAHKALGHKRDGDGGWEPNPRRRAPKDRNDEKLAEAPERWAAAVAPYRDRVLALLDEHADALDGERRAAVIAELLALHPDDEVVRARNGEVRLGDAWVLRETAQGKQSRPALKRIVADAYARAPEPERFEPEGVELELGIDWAEAWANDRVRVLTTGDADEARIATQAAFAAGETFGALFGVEPSYPADLRFLLLASEADKEALLANHPGIDDATRRYFERILGAGVPRTGDFCHWSETAAHRRDGVVRILLSWFLREAYGVTMDHGWIHEGFGLYLTRSLVGTRLNWFALPAEHSTSAENAAFLAKLYDTSVNWMNEAYTVLRRERRPQLARFMKKSTTALTSEELLYSYVIAAYLLEGRPAEAPELLRRVGGGEDPARACVAVLGLSPEELDARVLKWLSQRR